MLSRQGIDIPLVSVTGTQNRSTESTGPSWWIRQGRILGVSLGVVESFSDCEAGFVLDRKAYMSGILCWSVWLADV